MRYQGKIRVLVVLACLVVACATTPLGKAQQLYSITLEATNTLFTFEYENRDRLGIRADVDKIRVVAKRALPALDRAMDAYKTIGDAATLEAAEEDVRKLLRDANTQRVRAGLAAIEVGTSGRPQ